MRWLVNLLGMVRHPPVDQAAIREQMTQEDPEFAHVRDVQHDAIQALTARRIADGAAIRAERRFWEQHGRQKPT